jgi:hypothetical protein
MMACAHSGLKGEYKFKEAYRSVKELARARQHDLDSGSDSDSTAASSDTDTDDSDSSTANDKKKKKGKCARKQESEISPAEKKVPESPRFKMDDLAKAIKEAVQATTRELVGSYRDFLLGSGSFNFPGGLPPHAPLIESFAVSTQQSRPPFHGRSQSYSGSGSFPRSYSRPNNITITNELRA